jgi:hypothetical protein
VRRSAWTLLLTLPLLSAAGVQLSMASFTSNTTSNGNSSLSANADWTAPAAASSVIAKGAGGTVGAIAKSGTFYVYANASDSGNPASGVSAVTANVNSLSNGGGAVALSAGSYTAGGIAYSYRSALLTAKSSLVAGTTAYTLTLTDAGANSATQGGFSVTVDNTVPTGSDVQTTNASGGTAGKPELGDVLRLTYSEPIEPISILAGWTGQATGVVVRITDGGAGNDVLTIRNSANSAQLPLGSVNLGRSDYVTATRDFGASATTSQMAQSGNAITITLGTASGTTATAAATAAMVWTPSATATDTAGNASTTTAKTETGTADLDF